MKKEKQFRRLADGTLAVRYQNWHPPNEKNPTWRWGYLWRRTEERTRAKAEQRYAAYMVEGDDYAKTLLATESPEPARPGTKSDMTAEAIYELYLDRHARERGITLPVFVAFWIVLMKNPLWSVVARTKRWLDDFVQYLKNRGVKPQTIKNQLRMYNAMIEFAKQAHRLAPEYADATHISVKQALKTKIINPPYAPWFDWEIAMFIEALEWENMAWDSDAQSAWEKKFPPGFCFAQIVRMIVHTGWRRNQVESLCVGQATEEWYGQPARIQRHGWIDTRSQTLFPICQKDGDQVRFPYARFEPVAQIIADQLEWRQTQNFTDGYFFRRGRAYKKNNQIGDWRKTRWKAMDRCRERCAEISDGSVEWGQYLPGYKSGRHLHGLRHTRITDLSKRGMRAETIALLTGQDPATIRDIYTHSDYNELLAGLNGDPCPTDSMSNRV